MKDCPHDVHVRLNSLEPYAGAQWTEPTFTDNIAVTHVIKSKVSDFVSDRLASARAWPVTLLVRVRVRFPYGDCLFADSRRLDQARRHSRPPGVPKVNIDSVFERSDIGWSSTLIYQTFLEES